MSEAGKVGELSDLMAQRGIYGILRECVELERWVVLVGMARKTGSGSGRQRHIFFVSEELRPMTPKPTKTNL